MKGIYFAHWQKTTIYLYLFKIHLEIYPLARSHVSGRWCHGCRVLNCIFLQWDGFSGSNCSLYSANNCSHHSVSLTRDYDKSFTLPSSAPWIGPEWLSIIQRHPNRLVLTIYYQSSTCNVSHEEMLLITVEMRRINRPSPSPVLRRPWPIAAAGASRRLFSPLWVPVTLVEIQGNVFA